MRTIFISLLLIGGLGFSMAQSPAEDLAYINATLKQYNNKDNYELMVEGNIIRLKYGRKDYESFRMPMDNAIAYIGPYSTGGGGTVTVYIACKDGSSCMNNGFGGSISLWFKDVSKGVPNMPEVARRTNRWILSLQANNATAQALSSKNDHDEIGVYLTNDMVLTAQNSFNGEAERIETMVAELENLAKTIEGNYFIQVKKMVDELEQMNDRLYKYMTVLAAAGKEVSRLYSQEAHQQYFEPLYRQIDNIRHPMATLNTSTFASNLEKKRKPKIAPQYCEFMAEKLTPYAIKLRELANRKAPN